jgi:hypothetical protein
MLAIAARAEAASPADEAFARAERADADFRFAEALAAYDQVSTLDPSNRHAMQAKERAAVLRSHAEGNFEPFVALERVRRDPRYARDPMAIHGLADAADDFPEGLVRVEAWQLCAEADAHRLDRGDDAMMLAEKVLRDPRADGLARTEAARIVFDVAQPRRDFDRALRAASTEGVAPDLAMRVRLAARRYRLSFVAGGATVAWLAASALSLVVAPRRKRTDEAAQTVRKTIRLAAAAGAAIACAGLVASSYEGASPRPFFWLGGAVALVGATSAFVGARTTNWRALRSISGALAVVAVGFLALYASGPDYLEGFGL